MRWPWTKPPRVKMTIEEFAKKYEGMKWGDVCQFSEIQDLVDFVDAGGLDILEHIWQQEEKLNWT